MNEKQLFDRIKRIHLSCFKLCKQILGAYLDASGNIGVFCQSEREYEIFMRIRKELTEMSNHPDQKYFRLYQPIIYATEGEIPEATYTHLYIRKPDPTPYGKYLGDVDFILDSAEYQKLKESVTKGLIKGAEVYDRPKWDTVQMTSLDVDSVAYVSTKEFAEKVRVKFE